MTKIVSSEEKVLRKWKDLWIDLRFPSLMPVASWIDDDSVYHELQSFFA